LIDTGDSNRWLRDLQTLGIDRVADYKLEFDKLFRQN
jgi:hypothetical protein